MTIQRQVKGVLGEKLGMTQVWDSAGRLVPVTVVQAGPCVVTQVRNGGTDGYDGVQIAFGVEHVLYDKEALLLERVEVNPGRDRHGSSS